MIELSEDMDYYALRVAPTREGHVATLVENRGLADAAMFMPRLVRASRYSKRLVPSDQPALCGYVFVAFHVKPNWFAVRNASRAIIGVVGVGAAPAKVVYSHLLRFMAPHLFPSPKETAEEVKRLAAVADSREREHRRAIATARSKTNIGGFAHIAGFVENATKNHAVVALGLLDGEGVSAKHARFQRLDETKNAA